MVAELKKRWLFRDLKKYLSHKNALIITGMRQVGKTTLMRQLFDEVEDAKLFFDFDNPLDMKYFEDIDYANIYERLKNKSGPPKKRLFVFIDEVQQMPDITRIVKYHIDHFGVKYVLTGSSNFYLKHLFPESLSGRKFIFQLDPLSFREFLYFKDELGKEPDPDPDISHLLQIENDLMVFKEHEADYNEYLEFGGFPEVVVTRDFDTKRLILNNIFASFFEKDLGLLKDIQDVREMRDLILLLAPRVGNLLSITRLASELGISRPKIYQYLEYLQGVFFLRLIPKYSKSIDRSVAGGRKVYFSDNGLLNTITKVTMGQLFENAVSNQLKPYGELSFYNRRNVEEIDFILNKQVAFEVKVTGIARDISKLQRISEDLGLSDFRLISKNFLDHEKVLSPRF